MTRLIQRAAELPPRNKRRAAVFTMGALHAGHVALMHAARKLVGEAGEVVVTIFVNPTQFNDPQDLAKYPRTLEADVILCTEAGVDWVFAPSVDEMYPPHQDLPQFSAGKLGTILEGASRPGHFDAVATVVHRLLDLTEPHVTVFGEKDYQQVAVVRRMVAESRFPVEVVAAPTVRESDGLAMSSRNVRLDAHARQLAAEIPTALSLAVNHLAINADPDAAAAQAIAHLQNFPEIEIDYVVVTDVQLREAPIFGEARILCAVVVDGVRLIDNMPCRVGSAL